MSNDPGVNGGVPEMAEYPISVSEAARRLDIPIATASILVRAFEIPTVEIPSNAKAKGLERPSYLILKARSASFRRPARLEPAAVG